MQTPTATPAPATVTDLVPQDAAALHALYQHALFNAYKYFPEGARLSALTHIAAVIGRAFYTPYGAGTNLYSVLIAPSSWGKEGCITEARDLLRIAARTPGCEGLDQRLGNAVASPQAMREELSKKPSHVSWLSEFGKLIKEGQKNMIVEGTFDFMTRVYTRSGDRKVLEAYVTRNSQTNIGEVFSPQLSCIGEGAPTDFEALSPDAFSGGGAARYLYARALTIPPRNRQVNRAALEAVAVNAITKLYLYCSNREDILDRNGRVDITPEAWQWFEAKDDYLLAQNEEQNKLGNAPVAALIGRIMEIAIKLASIVAVCRHVHTASTVVYHPNEPKPVITLADLKWAYTVVEESVGVVCELMKIGIIGGTNDDVRKERVRQVLRNWLADDGAHAKKKEYFRYHNQRHIVPKGYIQNYVGSKHFPDDRDLERVLKSLVDGGVLQEYVNPTAEQVKRDPDLLTVKGKGYLILDAENL